MAALLPSLRESATAVIPQQVAAGGYGVSGGQSIGTLSNVTISNPVITGGSVPSSSIVGTLGNAIDTALGEIDDLTSNSITATNLSAGSASTTNLTATTISIPNSSTPSSSTNDLYASGGSLYWGGNLLGGASTGNWASDGSNVWRTTGLVGIGTATPRYALDVSGLGHFTGLVDAASFVATSSSATSLLNGNLSVNGSTLLGNATTTSLALASVPSSILKTNTLGSVIPAVAGTDYLATTTGDWSGTFGLHTPSYYLDARNLTNFAVPFSSMLAATTSLPNITTLSSLSLPYTQITGAPTSLASSTLLADSDTFSGAIKFTNGVTLGNATSTNFFSSIASSTNLFAQTASLGTLQVSGLTTLSGGLANLNINAPLANGANNLASLNTWFTGTGGSGFNNIAAYTFTRSGDTLNYQGNNYGSVVRINGNFGGAGMTGSRAGLDVSMVMRGTTSNDNNGNQYYVGIADYTNCGYNDNGTLGFTSVLGSCVALNPIASLGAGATNWYTLNPEEVDTEADASSSAAHTFGILNVKNGPQGMYDDAAEAFVGSPWKYIFQIGKTDGSDITNGASNASTTILGCVASLNNNAGCIAGAGIDLSDNWTWASTSRPFASPGFSIDGLGDMYSTSLITPSIGTQGGVTSLTNISGGSYAFVPTVSIAAPPSGGSQALASVATMGLSQWYLGSGGLGYSVNDVLTFSGGTCSVEPVIKVTSVSAGVITGTSGINGGVCSSPNFGPVTLTGGTGSGATLSSAHYYVGSYTVLTPGQYSTAPTVIIQSSPSGSATASAVLGSATLTLTGGGSVESFNTGSFGFGTTTPATTLSTNGSGYFTGGLGIGLVNTTSGTIQSTGNILGGGILNLNGTSGTTTIATGQGFTIGGSQFLVQQGSGNVGIGTTSPGSIFSIGGVANWSGATSTYYSTGGINLTNGCFAVNGSCIGGSTGNVASGTQGQFAFYNAAGNTLTATSSIFLSSASYVGIGSSTPASTLSVGGNAYITGGLGVGAVDTYPGEIYASADLSAGVGGSGAGLIVNSGSARFYRAGFSDLMFYLSNSGNNPVIYSNGGSSSLSLGASNATAMTISSTERIAVGTSSAYSKLEVWGPDTASTTAFAVVNNASTTVFASYDNGNATYSGSLFQSSDQRLKTNISSLDASSSLAFVDQLNPVSYTRIDQPDQGTTLGFIAQEVQKLFPNLVTVTAATALTPGGTLTLNYTGLIAPLVAAVQALQSEIAAVQGAIAGFAQGFTTQRLCLTNPNGVQTCITQAQLATILAAANTSNAAGVAGISSGISSTTPPVIEVNGNNPAIVQVGETYDDLGATITAPQSDLNLGIKTFLNGVLVSPLSVDTSQAATDTIAYVVTDQNGLTSTSTRVVIVQVPVSPQLPSVSPAASSSAATSTGE